jgi:hypothetical protein
MESATRRAEQTNSTGLASALIRPSLPARFGLEMLPLPTTREQKWAALIQGSIGLSRNVGACEAGGHERLACRPREQTTNPALD